MYGQKESWKTVWEGGTGEAEHWGWEEDLRMCLLFEFLHKIM